MGEEYARALGVSKKDVTSCRKGRLVFGAAAEGLERWKSAWDGPWYSKIMGSVSENIEVTNNQLL